MSRVLYWLANLSNSSEILQGKQESQNYSARHEKWKSREILHCIHKTPVTWWLVGAPVDVNACVRVTRTVSCKMGIQFSAGQQPPHANPSQSVLFCG